MSTTPEPTLAQLQQEIAQLRQQYRAVSQYLWIAIRQFRPDHHEAVLDTSNVDPLWAVAFLQVRDSKGEFAPDRIQVLAGADLPMNDQEKKRLVRLLKEKPELTLADAMTEQKLSFPPDYVERLINDRVVWRDGKWTAVDHGGDN